MGVWGSFPRVKRPGRDAENSPLFASNIKNAWNCTFTRQYVIMEW